MCLCVWKGRGIVSTRLTGIILTQTESTFIFMKDIQLFSGYFSGPSKEHQSRHMPKVRSSWLLGSSGKGGTTTIHAEYECAGVTVKPFTQGL